MAVAITYNPNIYSLFNSYFDYRKDDLIESLVWLKNDEKNMGVSEEQRNLIRYLAHFYFFAIYLINLEYNSEWTYLDWLTQEEYDIITKKMSIEFNTHEMILVPGKLPTAAPVTPPSSLEQSLFETTFDTVGGSIVTVVTTVTSEPIVISLFDGSGVPIALNAGIDIVPRIVGGVYVFDIYCVDTLLGLNLKILF